jgi:hypothetical protein
VCPLLLSRLVVVRKERSNVALYFFFSGAARFPFFNGDHALLLLFIINEEYTKKMDFLCFFCAGVTHLVAKGPRKGAKG